MSRAGPPSCEYDSTVRRCIWRMAPLCDGEFFLERAPVTYRSYTGRILKAHVCQIAALGAKAKSKTSFDWGSMDDFTLTTRSSTSVHQGRCVSTAQLRAGFLGGRKSTTRLVGALKRCVWLEPELDAMVLSEMLLTLSLFWFIESSDGRQFLGFSLIEVGFALLLARPPAPLPNSGQTLQGEAVDPPVPARHTSVHLFVMRKDQSEASIAPWNWSLGFRVTDIVRPAACRSADLGFASDP
ncbi:hypothetical protein N657DRAFT_203311 [Parathielavia appendiculata]|uniref:Uncharacterized protein n=1 Tax=Parathielavia appendiculata TaxID=2587402 RepID=A0AAN6U6C6_9PEZI|nr:hypothetical protein N657DRAFT_203311 [Parathielavia appendiculata]